MIGRAQKAVPTIKGVFVNSHIEALRKKKGDTAIAELKERTGLATRFGTLESVPIKTEVEILEHTVDILSHDTLAGSERIEAAGALHFENFYGTSLGRALMQTLPHTRDNFVMLLNNSPSIANVIFANSAFNAEANSDCTVITISNCDYPEEHFKGFFSAWMKFWGLSGRVNARQLGPRAYSYTLIF